MTPATDEELGEVRRLPDELRMRARSGRDLMGASVLHLKAADAINRILSRLESERERREAAEKALGMARWQFEQLARTSRNHGDPIGLAPSLDEAAQTARAHFATHTGEGDE